MRSSLVATCFDPISLIYEIPFMWKMNRSNTKYIRVSTGYSISKKDETGMNTQSQNFSGNLNRNSIIFQWILGIQRASFSGHDSLGKISSFCQNGATRKRLFQDRLRNTKGGRCFLQKGWYPLNMQQDATRCEKPTVCSSCSERETMGFCTFLACLP